ncbi:sigma-54 dependent transcriptional regulator [Blastopirellula sp. JC732]|uniref:Sigma-54 dependent transcriptional regulator n=1 Tax=Blastopirellula sediminis TaxID=2894196 RepID=A0A9X1SGE1_9BACT|nr:sigma-54 dependent transcriptional regulator [Blastopirellula sediminis]MCC9608336.1 sigma-54 dependent transcriptional regulator [Blastopirellula sediminis]MCC9628887.1 sigma-54 dependent transcriptional regulator [Blastopirellula sediminis]
MISTNRFCHLHASRVLVVDGDPNVRHAVKQLLAENQAEVDEVASVEEAVSKLELCEYDVILLDVGDGDEASLDLFLQLKGKGGCEVVCVSGDATIESAVALIKLGAFEFLTKPLKMVRLQQVLNDAVLATGRRRSPLSFPFRHDRPQPLMVGQSPSMQEVFRLIKLAGPTDRPILIQGESGTGKELVARALHNVSGRAGRNMVVVNCAALPESLLESELFGHEKGAFTGASAAKPGLFETADGGTLFIDEIGEMTGGVQAKLLRVLEDGTYRRVGATKERHANVRLVTATNRDLKREVREGRFREDLYYRIDVMRLELPPLRQRGDDVTLLTHHFMGNDWQIESDALQAIERFDWPGNIRQLINAIERAKILADRQTIQLQNLPAEVAGGKPEAPVRLPTKNFDLESLRKQCVQEVMSRENGNKVRAARALGISRRCLYRLLEKYDMA